MGEDSLEILRRVRSGEISVEDGAKRLESLDPGSGANSSGALSEDASPDVRYAPAAEIVHPELSGWGQAWQVLFWTGTGILTLSAVFMGWAYSSNHFFWFYCLWLPMLLGTLAVLLSWWSRKARWVHVRVNGADGKRVSISIPLPLSLASWVLRVFGRWIPAVKEQHLEDLSLVLDELGRADGPIIVDVDDKNGETVRIYIM